MFKYPLFLTNIVKDIGIVDKVHKGGGVKLKP